MCSAEFRLHSFRLRLTEIEKQNENETAKDLPIYFQILKMIEFVAVLNLRAKQSQYLQIRKTSEWFEFPHLRVEQMQLLQIRKASECFDVRH